MAFWKAAVIGAVGAIAIPYLTRGSPEMVGGLLHIGVTHMQLGANTLLISFPIFAVVTLFSWGFFVWSNR